MRSTSIQFEWRPAVLALVFGVAVASEVQTDEPRSVVGRWKPREVSEGKLQEHYVFNKDGTGRALLIETNGKVAVDRPLTWKQNGDKVTILLNKGTQRFELELYDKGKGLRYVSEFSGGATHYARAADQPAAQEPVASVVGRWKHKDPDFIGELDFRKDGTGTEFLGPIATRFTWKQSGAKVTAKYDKSTENYEVKGDTLKSTRPGSKDYMRSK